MAKTGLGNTARRASAAPRRCPICGKPATARHQPFCSAHCANIDLGRWLDGNYRVATEETPEAGPEEGAGLEEVRGTKPATKKDPLQAERQLPDWAELRRQ